MVSTSKNLKDRESQTIPMKDRAAEIMAILRAANLSELFRFWLIDITPIPARKISDRRVRIKSMMTGVSMPC
jgi:hypothetical protein